MFFEKNSTTLKVIYHRHHLPGIVVIEMVDTEVPGPDKEAVR